MVHACYRTSLDERIIMSPISHSATQTSTARQYLVFRLGGLDYALDFSKVQELRPLKELCLLYTSPSPRDRTRSRMPSSA